MTPTDCHNMETEHHMVCEACLENKRLALAGPGSIPAVSAKYRRVGRVRLIASSWKGDVPKGTVGSNPSLSAMESRPTGRCGYDNCASDGTTGAGNTGLESPVQPSSRARNPNRCH